MAAAKSKARALVESLTGQDYGPAPEGFTVRARSGNPFSAPGDTLQGVYQGPGKVITVKGKEIATFNVEKEGGEVVSLLAASQIEEFFNSIEEGDECWIQYQGQVKGGKGRVNVYKFATRAKVGKSKK